MVMCVFDFLVEFFEVVDLSEVCGEIVIVWEIFDVGVVCVFEEF